jgi:uncharacterized protein (TIGR03085 family)
MHPSQSERAALCDLFDELGPEAPTLCEGWRTTELAAHLWVREHRPDAAPGLLGRGPFAGHTDRLQRTAAQRPYTDVLAELRAGPPRWWFGRWVPTGDLHEWFVHHEDVRRADGRPPRQDDRLDDALWGALKPWGKALTRRAEVGVELATPDGRRRTAKAGDPEVTLTGRPGELMLTLFGRAADVRIEGSGAAVAGWNRSDIGI